MKQTGFLTRSWGVTLPEILTAAAIVGFVLMGAYTLFFQAQKTINKAAWIQQANREIAICGQHFSRFFEQSSYPSTVRRGILTDVSKGTTKASFHASLVGTGDIPLTGLPKTLLSIPCSKPQTDLASGTLDWIALELIPSNYSGQADLRLTIRRSTYNPPAPTFTRGMDGISPTSGTVFQQETILRCISEVRVAAVSSGNSPVELHFTLKYPMDHFKKTARFSGKLNVELQSP
jgi:hypothetical protein